MAHDQDLIVEGTAVYEVQGRAVEDPIPLLLDRRQFDMTQGSSRVACLDRLTFVCDETVARAVLA